MDIVLFVAGLLVGWLISHLYYVKARRDAEDAAEAQSLMLRTLLEAAEKAGHVELNRDANGRITGGHNVRIALQGSQMTVSTNPPTVVITHSESGR